MSNKEVVKVTRAEIVEMMYAHKKLFCVTFHKLDKSVRVLVGKTGVSKHTVGGERTTDPNEYVIVFETNNENITEAPRKCYRNVSISGIISLSINHKLYVPID